MRTCVTSDSDLRSRSVTVYLCGLALASRSRGPRARRERQRVVRRHSRLSSETECVPAHSDQSAFASLSQSHRHRRRALPGTDTHLSLSADRAPHTDIAHVTHATTLAAPRPQVQPYTHHAHRIRTAQVHRSTDGQTTHPRDRSTDDDTTRNMSQLSPTPRASLHETLYAKQQRRVSPGKQ